MSLLSFFGLGKQKKSNNTQNYQDVPQAQSTPLFGSLSELARKRINNEGTGFGDDFEQKAGNPQAQRMRQDFLNYTNPFIASEASKRGLGRSNLVVNRQALSAQENESNIDKMMAEFYKLNQAQKKQDVQSGINLGNELDQQVLNQGNQSAANFNAAEAGNTNRTAAVTAQQNANAFSQKNNTLNALGSLVGGPLGGSITKALGLGDDNIFGNYGQMSTADLIKALYMGGSGVKTQTI